MSRKNHRVVNGQLIRLDKSFSHLKPAQIDKIGEWLYLAYSGLYWENKRPPDGNYDDTILDSVYAKIEDADIWIPYEEVQKYYRSNKAKFQRRYKRESG